LQLPALQIASFRAGLVAAAESIGPAITRARVRVVDAVVSVRDLTLPTAESLEALQPFGNGNPEVRLVVPGCIVEGAATMGQDGRHLQLRLRAGAAHARAVGWSMGERMPRIAVGERHDAVVQLAVDRWQELVGPKVTLDGLDPLTAAGVVAAQCAQPCDIACPDRIRSQSLRELVDGSDHVPPAPRASSPPLGVRDRRGEGTVVATLAALCGADRGVAAIVADAAQRRVVLADVLAPARLGVEVAVLGGGRCDVDALRARVAAASGRSTLLIIEYGVLPVIELPPDVHVALVDPPPDAESAGWAHAHAAARWLHLLWGDEETAFALKVAERQWELRPVAGEIWRALNGVAHHPWGNRLDQLVLGASDPMRPPATVAAAVQALAQIGLLRVDATGIHPLEATGTRLEEAPIAIACRTRLEQARAFIAQAGALSFAGSAVSCDDARAIG
jgi:hypothetical protein